MATAETGPVSSLVAVREVILPNRELREFRTQLKTDAKHILGYSATHTVEVPTAFDEARQMHDEVEYEDVGALDADFFSLHSIRVVLFARRASASREVNALLRRAHDRLTSDEFYTGRKSGLRRKPVALPNELPEELKQIQRDEGFPNGVLPVIADSVANVSPLGASEQLYRLMIQPDTPYARVLTKQHKKLAEAARQIRAVKELGERFDSDADPLGLNIIRLPGGQNRETQKFELAMNMHKDVSFVLQPLEWQLKLGAVE